MAMKMDATGSVSAPLVSNLAQSDGISARVESAPVRALAMGDEQDFGGQNAAPVVLQPSPHYRSAMPSMQLGNTDVVEPNIWMPTDAQQGELYKNIVNTAMENGSAQLLDGPPASDEVLAQSPRWDNSQGRFDAQSEVFLIEGELYAHQASILPSLPGTWLACGPAPLFMPKSEVPPQIWMPTSDVQGSLYANIANEALKAGTARDLMHPPASEIALESAPHWNITPKFAMGVQKDVYLVHNRLYVRTETLTQANSVTWKSVGPAPMFTPAGGSTGVQY